MKASHCRSQVTRSADSYVDLFAEERQRLVYLTADSDTELTELDPQVFLCITVKGRRAVSQCELSISLD